MSGQFTLSRRAVLAGGLATLMPGPGWAAISPDTCDIGTKPTNWKARPERAVSLRQLSAQAAAGKRGLKLDGLTRLDGYVIDKENADIVLWGLAERGQSDLYFDDFVVALRAASDKYIEVKDGVRYRVAALISIDPNPDVLKRLRELNLFSPGGLDQRARMCASPQTVRVEGMPRDTRVAKVLVDADYRMKQVSQGSVKLPIPSPFPADFDARVASWRADDEAGRGGKASAFNIRYWFQPGSFSYQASADADTVFMDVAQVVLNDEDQVLRPGKLEASGKINPISRAFTCAWTNRMEDTYKAEPIWRDMHNIFRHFGLAKIMADREAFMRAGFDGEFLLDRYEIAKVSVPDSLPGLGRVIPYDTKSGRTTTHHLPNICGGVSIGFQKPLDTNPETDETKSSTQGVLAARPAPTTVAWAIDPSSLKNLLRSSPKPASPAAPAAAPAPATPAPADGPSKSLKDLFKT
jgi:hypothetical protein